MWLLALPHYQVIAVLELFALVLGINRWLFRVDRVRGADAGRVPAVQA